MADVYVENGILAPKKQGFKALIVRGKEDLTVLGAERIAQIARDGLPVIFSGGTPSNLVSFNASGTIYVRELLQGIRELDNVHEVAADSQLADVVASLGIRPRSEPRTSTSTWWTVWTHNEELEEDYIYIYHAPDWPGTATGEGTIEFESTGVPYLLNAWSGEETPIYNYTQTDSTTIIWLRLVPEQTAIIAFKNKETHTPLHVIATSHDVIGIAQSAKKELEAHVGYRAGGCYASVKTSDGKRHAVKPTSARPFELRDWTLTVEHWDPPTDFYDIETIAIKHNTTHQLPYLTAWKNINGLENVSGLGFYTATFNWPPSNDSTGALISFGTVVHTLDVSVNGQVLLALDVKAATADITKYLVPGQNTVSAVVSTTLANVLLPRWDDLLTSGAKPEGLFGGSTRPSSLADYGLLNPVIITPYNSVVVG
jgi:hypothetical protein